MAILLGFYIYKVQLTALFCFTNDCNSGTTYLWIIKKLTIERKSMKYLVNFKIKAQGWSEIVEVPSNQDSEQDRSDAREKAAELLANRILNSGILTLIDTSNINTIPMQLEKVKKDV